ncbi:spermidine synthase [Thiogranum longum]
MSIVWERNIDNTDYQVRRAGCSLRLYTNGVFHSQYNPQRPVTGNIWDLLFLPAFFYPNGEIRRVLVLGVGGGAVIQQLRRFIRPDRIVGIELSAVHLSIARRFFGVRGKDVELLHADAVDWVRRYRGPAFDMIVDDLFGEQDGEPQRAVFPDTEWISLLTRCLAEKGMIVCNFASRLELMASAFVSRRGCRNIFASGFHLSTSQNFNAVGAFLGIPATTRQLRERLHRIAELDTRRRSARLQYRIRTLTL